MVKKSEVRRRKEGNEAISIQSGECETTEVPNLPWLAAKALLFVRPHSLDGGVGVGVTWVSIS